MSTARFTYTEEDFALMLPNTEENDDWMKALPGYANEVKLHEELAKKLKLQTKKVKVKR